MRSTMVSLVTQIVELILFFATAFLLANGLLGWQ
jgi:hypothetical protein